MPRDNGGEGCHAARSGPGVLGTVGQEVDILVHMLEIGLVEVERHRRNLHQHGCIDIIEGTIGTGENVHVHRTLHMYRIFLGLEAQPLQVDWARTFWRIVKLAYILNVQFERFRLRDRHNLALLVEDERKIGLRVGPAKGKTD